MLSEESPNSRLVLYYKIGKPFDIVFMDFTIHGGKGEKEIIDEILAINPNTKVIVTSAYPTDDVIANFEKYGFKGRLIKPFKIEDIKKIIKKNYFIE